jgi:hypothetical protein
MKLIAFLTAVATSLALSSVAAPVAPTPCKFFTATQATTLKAPPDILKDEFVSENSFLFFAECVGEFIEVTQTVYFRILIVDNGKRVNSPLSIRREGTAIGLTTGTEYIMRGNYNDVANASYPTQNNQFSYNATEHFDLISPGSGTNIAVRYKSKYILNAKGGTIIDAFFGETTITCR